MVGRAASMSGSQHPKGLGEMHYYECGCAWYKLGANLWQVVACLDHHMDSLPKTEPLIDDLHDVCAGPLA
jgi:hypothetical protein